MVSIRATTDGLPLHVDTFCDTGLLNQLHQSFRFGRWRHGRFLRLLLNEGFYITPVFTVVPLGISASSPALDWLYLREDAKSGG